MFKLAGITVNLARKDTTVTSVTPCVAKLLCKPLIQTRCVESYGIKRQLTNRMIDVPT